MGKKESRTPTEKSSKKHKSHHAKHAETKPIVQTLEDVNPIVPGPKFLTQQLFTVGNIPDFITKFQANQGIRIRTVASPIPLLTMHGVKRLTFHERCYDLILEEVKRQIDRYAEQTATEKEASDQEKGTLEKLLEFGFPYANVPRINPAVLHLLKKIPKLPDQYINEIAQNKPLYDVCDIRLKRQIWLEHKSLFDDEVAGHMKNCIESREREMFDTTKRKGIFGVFSPERRKHEDFRKLVGLIGGNEKLYRLLKTHLRQRFAESNSSPHYASLKADLIFGVHEISAELEPKDSLLYKFAWILEDIAEKAYLEDRHATDIVDILDQFAKMSAELDAAVPNNEKPNKSRSKKQEKDKEFQAKQEKERKKIDKNFKQLAFLVLQPSVLFALGLILIKAMDNCLKNEQLPKQNRNLMIAIRLLNIAAEAPKMLTNTSEKKKMTSSAVEPVLDDEVSSTFIPLLLSTVMDAQLSRMKKSVESDSKTPIAKLVDHDEKVVPIAEPVKLVEIFEFVKTNPVCVYIFVNFVGFAFQMSLFHLSSMCAYHMRNSAGNMIFNSDIMLHYFVIMLSLSTNQLTQTGGHAGASDRSVVPGVRFRKWTPEFSSVVAEKVLLYILRQRANSPSQSQAAVNHILTLIHFNMDKLTTECCEAGLRACEHYVGRAYSNTDEQTDDTELATKTGGHLLRDKQTLRSLYYELVSRFEENKPARIAASDTTGLLPTSGSADTSFSSVFGASNESITGDLPVQLPG